MSEIIIPVLEMSVDGILSNIGKALSTDIPNL